MNWGWRTSFFGEYSPKTFSSWVLFPPFSAVMLMDNSLPFHKISKMWHGEFPPFLLEIDQKSHWTLSAKVTSRQFPPVSWDWSKWPVKNILPFPKIKSNQWTISSRFSILIKVPSRQFPPISQNWSKCAVDNFSINKPKFPVDNILLFPKISKSD